MIILARSTTNGFKSEEGEFRNGFIAEKDCLAVQRDARGGDRLGGGRGPVDRSSGEPSRLDVLAVQGGEAALRQAEVPDNRQGAGYGQTGRLDGDQRD